MLPALPADSQVKQKILQFLIEGNSNAIVEFAQKHLPDLSDVPPIQQWVKKRRSLGEVSPVARSYQPHVLLVEDDLVAQKVGKRLLEKVCPSDAVIELAANGMEALKMEIDLRRDLIIMDIRMPKLCGDVATRVIRALGDSVPIVGCSSELDAAKLLEKSGANGVMAKNAAVDVWRDIVDFYLPLKNSAEL